MEWEELEKKYGIKKKKPSKLWYLLPIFLSIIGGVIGYFLLKDRDRKFAERLLIIGLVVIVIVWLAQFLLAGLVYLYIAGVFTEAVQGIEVVSADCIAGNATFIIENIGTATIDSILVTQISPVGDTASDWYGELESGKTIIYTDNCMGVDIRTCTYKFTPSRGRTTIATAYCT